MRRAVLGVALAAALAAGAVQARQAEAATPDDYAALAAEMAAPWPALQRADGSFPEYVSGHDPRNVDDYGEAMLGYGLLQTGVRDGNEDLVGAGLRAVTRDATLPDAGEPVRMFRNMAIAAAYNLARERIPENAEFARVRGAWEERMKQVRIARLDPHRPVTNKALVESVEILELARSGLTSGAPGTVLHDPAGSARVVERFLAGRLPRARSAAGRGDAPAARLALLGDPPDFPLAYHALATGFLARAIELLGPRAPASARRLLKEAVAASWALAGPDGDLAYAGRSQEQIWALALTAHAAEFAARSSDPGAAGSLRGLAQRATERLGRDHRGGPVALAITPALARDLAGGSRGVDSYVSAVQYSGLGLVGLNWARDQAQPGPVTGDVAAGGEGSAVLGTGGSRFAAVRAGDVWFVVRQAPGAEADLRYDFGLVALKVRAADGTWHDQMPIRPISRTRADSAGPLLRSGGRAGAPVGTALGVGPHGDVTVAGGYRRADGRWVRRGVRFRYEALTCGVRMDLSARAGDVYEYSAFMRPGDSLRDLAFDPQPTAAAAGRYSSGSDPRLSRLRLRFPAFRKRGRLTISTCTQG